MRTSHTKHGRLTRLFTGWLIAGIFAIGAEAVSATSYISVEPVPNVDVIGQASLNSLRGIGYANLELWSQRLLNECGAVDNVIDALTANGAITTITPTNTRFVVAAGGFEGTTNPSFVFTIRDVGVNSASQADVNVLSNALGYVQSQGGTAHFSPDNAKAYAFALDYAVVTFSGSLSGQQAGAFFEHLGTIDPALFSGTFAGFTQINFGTSLTNNSMLFLQPAVSKNRFISGLFAAASDDPRATYSPLKSNGTPTTAQAGIAFPENDWLAFPNGDQYLANIPASPQLLGELAALRLRHLVAVANLLDAIARDKVEVYLNHQFRCPE
ncbi:MAG: hypothetical protein ACM4AI_04390 [Acidobacteriota bacterium]